MSDLRQADPASPAARIGAELRAARERLGWRLPELSQSLRIREAYLDAIERGRIADLPGPTYALGFVRTYASALGLPGDEIAGRYRAEAEVNRRPELAFPVPVPQRGVPAGALMLLGLVILIGAYTGWYFWTEHRAARVETVPPIPDRLAAEGKPAPSPQVATILPSATPPPPAARDAAVPPPPSGTPAVPAASPPPGSTAPVAQAPPASAEAGHGAAPPAAGGNTPTSTPVPATHAPPAPSAPAATVTPPATPPAAPAPAGTRVVVRATADAWVTIKPTGGGAPLFNKLMHAGDSWPLPPNAAGALLTTGNAGGTTLDVDGKPAGSLGGSGAVRRNLPLDPEALKAGVPPLPPRHRPAAAPALPGTGGG